MAFDFREAQGAKPVGLDRDQPDPSAAAALIHPASAVAPESSTSAAAAVFLEAVAAEAAAGLAVAAGAASHPCAVVAVEAALGHDLVWRLPRGPPV